MGNKKPEIKSWKNLESAFAGESMAYQKYLHFAKIARKNGDDNIADLFEETAKHELSHAQGHVRNLYPMKKLSTKDCLKLAMEGEEFEYTEMYPNYANTAKEESMEEWVIKEFEEGIKECKDHAELFKTNLEKLNKLFKGLAKVEKEHFENYQKAYTDQVEKVNFNESNNYLADKKLNE